jgi:tetratricopeptide (TPR) repeat protein
MSNQNGVAVYLPKGAGAEGVKRAAELAGLMTGAREFVAGVLGKAPDLPLRIVSSRRGAGFGSGGTAIVSDAVFRHSKIDSITAMNIAEAVAKMWLGNSASVNGEGYGVIQEGLSRYIATQFIESKFGKDVADVERLRQRNSYAAVSKRDSPLSTVSPLDDFYYPEVANKGAMVWRILAKRVGPAEFSNILRSNIQDGNLNMAELRSAFSSQKDLLDYLFDHVTDMNLLVGLPQTAGAETKVALRNTGAADVTVDIAATTITGEKISSSTSIRAASFGEVTFRSGAKVTRVEIDAEKMYPQTDYSDDTAPRESTDSDPLLVAKRFFDKQDFANAEIAARRTLRDLPRFDDLRILLGRSLLAQNKNAEAEREFRAVLDEKLPTSRSLAWALVGLAEVAAKAGQTDVALQQAQAAIMTDGDYGASLAARNIRTRLGVASTPDPTVKAFFVDFDRAASANRKAEIDALVMPGEVTKFAGGVSGSTEQWRTDVRQIDRVDADSVMVEANMTVKLLNKDLETGTAVYRLVRTAAGWRLAGVDMFETKPGG